MSNHKTKLPISCVFYGEITDSELQDFIQNAREALEICGYDFIKDLNPGTDRHKELWVTDALNFEGNSELIELDWGTMLDLKTIGIASLVLKSMYKDSFGLEHDAASAYGLFIDRETNKEIEPELCNNDGWDFYTESHAIYSNDGCDGLLFADGSTLILEGGVWVVHN